MWIIRSFELEQFDTLHDTVLSISGVFRKEVLRNARIYGSLTFLEIKMWELGPISWKLNLFWDRVTLDSKQMGAIWSYRIWHPSSHQGHYFVAQMSWTQFDGKFKSEKNYRQLWWPSETNCQEWLPRVSKKGRRVRNLAQ